MFYFLILLGSCDINSRNFVLIIKAFQLTNKNFIIYKFEKCLIKQEEKNYFEKNIVAIKC